MAESFPCKHDGRWDSWESNHGFFDQDQSWNNDNLDQGRSWNSENFDPDHHFCLDAQPIATRLDGDEFLQSSRINMFLADDNAPFAISAERFLDHEQRERALAELDGMTAGLKFLDKSEKAGCVAYLCSALRPGDNNHLLNGVGSGLCRNEHVPDLVNKNIPTLTTHRRLDDMLEDAPKPNTPAQPIPDVDRAWRGLRSLRRGMQTEFQNFTDVAAESASPTLCELRTQFPSSKALADQGSTSTAMCSMATCQTRWTRSLPLPASLMPFPGSWWAESE